MSTYNNAADFLLNGKDPSRLALRTLDQDHSYGELCETSSKVAQFLRSSGFQPGDRVLLIADNSLFWVATYLGILKAGLVCVPLPSSISAGDLDHIRGTTGARIIFAQARFAGLSSGKLKGVPCVVDRESASVPNALPFSALTASVISSSHPVTTTPDQLAALMFTSGSTGKPRGVMVSHRNIIANTESIVEYLGLEESDRIMTVLPFHYCFGTSLLHTHLRAGASMVLDGRFMYPEVILERMISSECTGFAGVPSHFQILLRKSSFRKKEFPHLRYVQQAGGHLAPNFVRELVEALPRAQIFVMYGQTEATARLAYVPPECLGNKMGSIGKSIPGVKLEVLDESGEAVPPGQIGEIVACGDNVTLGYWREPEETAKYFRGGKLYTGDMGTTDEDGFIYVMDRAKDFLKCGGKRVSCRQIEEKLLEFEDLLEVAIVGVSDEILGEAVKAFVVPKNPRQSDVEPRVLSFCKEQLPPPLVPKTIVVMNALPKNSAGKLLKQKLKDVSQNRDAMSAAL